MIGSGWSRATSRGPRGLLALGLILVACLGLSGCNPFGSLFGSPPPPTPSPTPVPTATATPMPLATPGTATPPSGPVTQAEGQAVVMAWFDALIAGDYPKAEGLTSGRAATMTRTLTDALQREAGRQAVPVRLEVKRLDFSPGPAVQSGQAVRADFTIDAVAGVGPLSLTASHIEGNATFVVDRVGGMARIVDMRDVNGLPTQ